MFSLKFKHIKGYIIEKQKLCFTFDHNNDISIVRHNPKDTKLDQYYVVFVSSVESGTMHIHLSKEDPEKKEALS